MAKQRSSATIFADSNIFMGILYGGIGHICMKELEREFIEFLPRVDRKTDEFGLVVLDNKELNASYLELFASPAHMGANWINNAKGAGDNNR